MAPRRRPLSSRLASSRLASPRLVSSKVALAFLVRDSHFALLPVPIRRMWGLVIRSIFRTYFPFAGPDVDHGYGDALPYPPKSSARLLPEPPAPPLLEAGGGGPRLLGLKDPRPPGRWGYRLTAHLGFERVRVLLVQRPAERDASLLALDVLGGLSARSAPWPGVARAGVGHRGDDDDRIARRSAARRDDRRRRLLGAAAEDAEETADSGGNAAAAADEETDDDDDDDDDDLAGAVALSSESFDASFTSVSLVPCTSRPPRASRAACDRWLIAPLTSSPREAIMEPLSLEVRYLSRYDVAHQDSASEPLNKVTAKRPPL